MTKRELAEAVAKKCPNDDGKIFAINHVQRLLDALPEVLLDELAKSDNKKVTIPGLLVVKKSEKKAWVSALDQKKHPATTILNASLAKSFKDRFKQTL